MANCCYVNIRFVCEPERDLKYLYNLLKFRFEEADKKHVGAFIGSENKYLFDPGVKKQGSAELILEGWVKWNIVDTDFVAICEWLKKAAKVPWIQCKYEEPAMGLFGSYVLADYYKHPRVIHTYLSELQLEDVKEYYSEDLSESPEEYEEWLNDCRELLEQLPCREITSLKQVLDKTKGK